jgi:hypothetical protein
MVFNYSLFAQTRVLSTFSRRAHALGYILIKTPDQAPAPSKA